MQSYTVTVEGTGETFSAREDHTVLEAMERRGRGCIQVGCRSGGCGVCRIEVRSGRWLIDRPMSREYVSEEDERAGRVLACRIRAASDLVIRRPASQERRGAEPVGSRTEGMMRGERPWQ